MNDYPKNKSHTTPPPPKKTSQFNSDESEQLASEQTKKNRIAQPDYPKILSGVMLILISVPFVVVTSPLAFLGSVLGFLSGAIQGKELGASSLNGAKIGSLGSISAFNFGLELTRATIESNSTTQLHSKLSENDASAPAQTSDKDITINLQEKADSTLSTNPGDTKNQDVSLKPQKKTNSTTSTQPGVTKGQDVFFAKSQTKPQSKPFKFSKSHDFNSPEDVLTFTETINQLISQDEAKAEPPKEGSTPKVKEPYIVKLIEVIKNPKLSGDEFWDRLGQMSDKDIQLLVGRLSSVKGKGAHSLTELDSLWRQFSGFEFEPSKREYKKNKFTVVLESLSDAQLTASLASPDFLKLLNIDTYIEAAANTLNRNQFALFASNSKNHDALNYMIKKLQPDPYLLGKLVSILPHATVTIKTALIDQITHLAHPASFKIELAKLAEHFIAINTKKNIKQTAPSSSTKESKPQASKWATVNASIAPVYASSKPVIKTDWTDEAFAAFIQELDATTYIINELKLMGDLNALPDNRIIMITERAALPEFKNLLTHFWRIEAKPLNHKSDIENREHRLSLMLHKISEDQLMQSIKENKFWEIFRNIQEPYCKMAAAELSPRQFELIIANAPIERHADFAVILTQLPKDSPDEKARFHQIVEAILPHTTPWFALALERQIKSLIAGDKHLFERFSAELKHNLTASLERPEVKFSYQIDTTLNKAAISQLLIESPEPHSTPPRLTS
ncbi:hypothetical protein ELY21_12760 [Legionella sp. km535]|uniref:hypothetical protein n=1 Tax=Legionella sp. km535 TaxID=2498107 RepID=UPI000F8F34D7|nr:hypothetical protein [Legionella sp. km535]RUR16581.1 hypothetical protein ELY21_12760 [Legionella sp. km535]